MPSGEQVGHAVARTMLSRCACISISDAALGAHPHFRAVDLGLAVLRLPSVDAKRLRTVEVASVLESDAFLTSNRDLA